jgi:6-phosphofructokinase 1
MIDPPRRVAVLTSGGDAPGMNAAIRAVVRSGVARGWDMLGVRYGYRGLINDDMLALGHRDVGGIIEDGGTMLRSARCPDFALEDGRRLALHHLYNRSVDALVVIGGNGSQTGAHALSEMGFPVIGVASTIDNDLYGSDITIGVDTALNVAVEAIDRLRTTASSHRRVSLVEVMGRHCGYLALISGLAGGAEAVVLPERPRDADYLVRLVTEAHERKDHALVVIAEGAEPGTSELARHLRVAGEAHDFETRVTVLGHTQRGGSPTAADRLLGSRLGAAATEYLAHGTHGILVGQLDGHVAVTPLAEVCTEVKQLDPALIALAELLEL